MREDLTKSFDKKFRNIKGEEYLYLPDYGAEAIKSFIRQREKELLNEILVQFEKEKWADSTDALRAVSAAIEVVTGKKWSWTKAIEEELSNE